MRVFGAWRGCCGVLRSGAPVGFCWARLQIRRMNSNLLCVWFASLPNFSGVELTEVQRRQLQRGNVNPAIQVWNFPSHQNYYINLG